MISPRSILIISGILSSELLLYYCSEEPINPVGAVSERDQSPTCSVPSPHRGTSNRIYYGVGTEQVLPNSGLGLYYLHMFLAIILAIILERKFR